MEQKTCMVTGHRNLPAEKTDYIKEQLQREILQAIEAGCTHFISGFAQGADLMFAGIVAGFQEIYSITLEAAIPYRNRLQSKHPEFQRLLSCCSIVSVHSERYLPGCFQKRNRAMVRACERVIAVYDGREKGGTFATMRFARVMKKDIHVIRL